MSRRTTSFLAVTVFALAMPFSASAHMGGDNFIQTWDFDGDGTVTLEDVLERRGVMFDGYDADEDGFLSDAEMADHDAQRDAMQESRERPDMGKGGMGQGGGYRQGIGMGPQGGQGRAMGPMGGRGPGMGQMGQGQMMPPPGWGQGQPPAFGYGQPQGFPYGPPQGYGFGPAPGWGQPYGMMPPGWGQPRGMDPQGMGRQGMGPMGMAPQGPAQQGMGPMGGRMMGSPGMGGQGMQQSMYDGLDADGDGQISRDEFVSAGEGWLPRFDRNGDGVVDATDFPAARTR